MFKRGWLATYSLLLVALAYLAWPTGAWQQPALEYSTYFGSAGQLGETLQAMTTDRDGNVYIAGATSAQDLPAGGATVNNLARPGAAAFIAKFDGATQRLLFLTYLGGSRGAGVARSVPRA